MVYLLFGEDEYLRNEYLKKIKKSFDTLQLGINYIQIDETNVTQIISDIETPAFGLDKKLIIAKDTGLFKKKNAFSEKLAEYLKENANNLEDVVLVFAEQEVEKNKLFNTIKEVGQALEFKEQNMAQLIKKVKSLANAYKVEIKENVAGYFIECVGTNMSDIINEIRKLIEYAGSGGEIKKEDIDSLSIKKSESIIFDLTDNLGKKKIDVALDVLHNLIYAKEPVQRILVMLYNHFKKLYIIKLAVEENRNIAQSLNLKPNQMFLVNKYSAQAKAFDKEELRNLLEELIKIDEYSKSGKIDINIGLESILCEYCSYNSSFN